MALASEESFRLKTEEQNVVIDRLVAEIAKEKSVHETLKARTEALRANQMKLERQQMAQGNKIAQYISNLRIIFFPCI